MQFSSITTFSVIFSVLIRENVALFLLEPTNLTTPNLVRDEGYPLEEHRVTTADGYILTLHRIPYSPVSSNRTDSQPKPVVVLMHGFIACSTDWIGRGLPDGLSYILSDIGFDVWMGNSRGNRYSEDHIDIDSKNPHFWDFSFHEMGVYDLPAIFEYIEMATQIDKFTYIGHSQGTTEFLVYCSMIPTCKSKIISAHLLAPVAFLTNTRWIFVRAGAPLFGQPDFAVKVFGSFNLAPNTNFLYLLGQQACVDGSPLKFLCSGFVYLSLGPSDYFNETILPYLIGIYPAGSSLKQVQHYLQIFNSGKFRQFDYGKVFNSRIYGSSTPPEYNLSNIAAPIYLYHSESDYVAVPEDVYHLAQVLPKAFLRDVYKVPPKKWNHFDCLYGINAKEFIYDEILKNIREALALDNTANNRIIGN